MKVSRWLEIHKNEIKCVRGCGNCCHNDIGTCGFLKPNKDCSLHPDLNSGQDRRLTVGHGQCFPKTTPEQAFNSGVYCHAVLQALSDRGVDTNIEPTFIIPREGLPIGHVDRYTGLRIGYSRSENFIPRKDLLRLLDTEID